MKIIKWNNLHHLCVNYIITLSFMLLFCYISYCISLNIVFFLLPPPSYCNPVSVLFPFLNVLTLCYRWDINIIHEPIARNFILLPLDSNFRLITVTIKYMDYLKEFYIQKIAMINIYVLQYITLSIHNI